MAPTALQSGPSYLCAGIQGLSLAAFLGSCLSHSVLCLRRSLFPELSRLWGSCLVGAGELLLAGSQHAPWQERIWRNPLILRIRIFLLSSVSDHSDVGHCPDMDCTGLELTLSMGSQIPGLGKEGAAEGITHMLGLLGPPRPWQFHLPGRYPSPWERSFWSLPWFLGVKVAGNTCWS